MLTPTKFRLSHIIIYFRFHNIEKENRRISFQSLFLRFS